MLNVTFFKYIFDADHAGPKARFTVLQRGETMAFAPTPGLEIQWPLLRPQKVVSFTWNTESQLLNCRLEDEYTANGGIDDPEFEEAVEQAKENGWQVPTIYPKS